MKKTIAIDFDGVIHSYTSGWTGAKPTDPPVPGAKEAIAKLRETYDVVIYSTRTDAWDRKSSRGGLWFMQEWLAHHGIEVDDISSEKPKAVVLIDDRGFRFTGDWQDVLDFVSDPENLKPWNKR